MKIIFFILISFVLSFKDNIRAQQVFNNDTSHTSIFESLIHQIDSSFSLEKNVDFELRFWTLIPKTAERRLFILTLKDSKWSARFFQKIIFQKDTLIEVPVSQENLEVLWKRLKKIVSLLYHMKMICGIKMEKKYSTRFMMVTAIDLNY